MRLLLIEDEAPLRAALTTGLEADGFRVETADRGDTGLELALTGDYAVIVLDLMLPGMNGFKVCLHLREAKVATPILLLTAKDGEYDEAEGLDSGADDYLAKPFSYVVLLARLRALLRRSTAELATLAHRDLSVDPARRTCRRGETDIPLTARELDLLVHLLRRYPAVVTKSELLAAVWGDEPDGEEELGDNVVYLYVGYLRRKIDEPFGATTIETVRGVGYRLAPG